MGDISWQLLILLILAIIVFMRLFNEFGKRDGFEPERKPAVVEPVAEDNVEVFEELDSDVDATSADAIRHAREIDPAFRMDTFLGGAKSAYEMILMAYLNGEIDSIQPYVDPEVYQGFADAIAEREAQGHKVVAEFIGFQDVKLNTAEFNDATHVLEIGVEFIAQLKQQVVDGNGEVVSGDKSKIEVERDIWFFERNLKSDDPNWTLVATDE